jgi:excisionase family DNA binding protein
LVFGILKSSLSPILIISKGAIMNSRLLNAKEVAQILNISKALAYRLMAKGDIPSVHFSQKTVRCSPEDLERFLKEKSTERGTDLPHPL